MPTQNISINTSSKTPNSETDKLTNADKQTGIIDKPQTPQVSDGATKMAHGAQEIAQAAGSVAAEKARQVRDQVEATATSWQSKASSLSHEAGAPMKHAAEALESTTRSAVVGAKEIIGDVADEAGELLHGARDIAVDSYDSARDYALAVVDNASELAQRASQGAANLLRRTSRETMQFARLHALPLAATGASLGWLMLSIRKSRSSTRRSMPARSSERKDMRSPRSELAVGRPSGSELGPTQRRSPSRDLRASPDAPTTSGSKLLGVPNRDSRSQV